MAYSYEEALQYLRDKDYNKKLGYAPLNSLRPVTKNYEENNSSMLQPPPEPMSQKQSFSPPPAISFQQAMAQGQLPNKNLQTLQQRPLTYQDAVIEKRYNEKTLGDRLNQFTGSLNSFAETPYAVENFLNQMALGHENEKSQRLSEIKQLEGKQNKTFEEKKKLLDLQIQAVRDMPQGLASQAVDAVTDKDRKLKNLQLNAQMSNNMMQGFANEKAENFNKLTKDMTKGGKFLANTAVGGINMLNSASRMGVMGLPMIAETGVASGVDAGAKTLEGGHSTDKALLMGLGSGAITAGVESLGGIGGNVLGKAFGKGAATQIGKSILSKIPTKILGYVTKASNSIAGNILKSSLSEGVEEGAEYVLQTFYENLLLDKDTPYDVKVAADKMLSAALIGGVFGTGKAISDYNSPAEVANRAEAKELNRIDNEYSLMENGNMFTKEKLQNSQSRKLPLGPYATDEMKAAYQERNVENNNNANKPDVKPILTKLKASIPDMAFDMPVKSLTGREFPKSEKKLTEQVGDFFKSIGNKVARQGFGEVILDEAGVQSDISHGLGRAKSVTFAAVPDVIAKGKQIDYQPDWKGRGKDSYVFAAPITIDGERNYVTAVVLKNKDNRLYLHEVLDGDGNLVYIKKEEPGIIKTGITVQDGITSEPSSSYNPTISQENSVVNNQSMQNGEIDAKNTDTFGKSTVGAAERNTNSYSAMQNDFGTIKPGENPFRVVDVPKSTQKGNKVRQFTRTIMEAEATPDDMIDAFETKVAEGIFSYRPKKDKESLATAIKTIEDKGYQGALSQWNDVANGYRRAGKDDIVLGETLYSLAAKNGDADTAMKLAGELSAELTNAGQAVQAARLLKKSSPEGKLYYAQKSVEYIQEKLTKKHKGEAPKLEIDKTLIENYLTTAQKGTEVEQDAALDEIFQNVADQVPATLADKWNAWRYLAMLGNTRTHIRNVVGNGLFYLTTKGKNVVGSTLEAGTNATLSLLGKKQIERTKTLNRANKTQKDFAKADFQKMKNVLTGTGKYNPSDIVMDKRKIFTSKLMAPVEGLRKLNNAALEAEDVFFLRLNYIDSMSKYLVANKLNPNLLSETQLEKARSYALNEAQRATFRDASKLATVLNRATNTNAFTKVVLGGTIPFTKTPINIAKRAIEYSPIGAAKAVKEMLVDVKRGDKTAAEAIDSLASGLTGSGIMALGFVLAQMGIVSGGNDEDKKQEGFDKLQGSQNYAVQTSGGSYTIDWAAPTAIPLFMGVEMFNLSSDTGNTFENIINSITTLSDPLVEMSVLQGINSTINTIKYDEHPMSALLMNSGANYVGQAVPTALGHIARAVDDTRRSTYIEKGKIKAIDSTVQKSLAKIPFASKALQPMIDAWGREVKNEGGNGFSRYAYNSLSPGYYKSKETTPLDSELERLYKSGVEENPYPTRAEKSFNVNGKTVNLTGDEYTKYAKEKGLLSFEIANKVIENKNYASMSDEEKAELIKKAYDYANAVAKSHVSDYLLSDTNEKIYKATQKDIAPYQYLYIKQNADIDENGSISQKEMENALNQSGLSELQKRYMWMVQFPKSPNNPYGRGS